MIIVDTVRRNIIERCLKRIVDISICLGALLILSPLLLIVSILIKLSSDGPIFYTQKRVGKGGKVFHMIKFRSMVRDAHKMKIDLKAQNEMDGPVFKMKNDPRITIVGRFIRKHSIDELPQILNILSGDMSVVGPRPPLPEEVASYTDWQKRRLSVTPGLTCIWQVSGRNRLSFEEWMSMDIDYIERWSLLLDLKLILRTLKVVIMPDGAY